MRLVIDTGPHSENLFQALLDECDEAVFVINTHSGEIEFCNRAAESIFGHSASEMVGRSFRMLHLNAGEYDRISGDIAERLGRNRVFETYGYLCRRDGSHFPCRQRAITVHSRDNRQVALYLVEDETRGESTAASASSRSEAGEPGKADLIWPVLRDDAGAHFDWDYAEIWVPDAEDRLSLRSTWARSDSSEIDRLIEESRSITFALGEGLPGRAWKRGKPELLQDVERAPPNVFRRGGVALTAGLRSWLAIPVHFRGSLVGVLDFASASPRDESGAAVEHTQRSAHRVAPLLYETWGRELDNLRARRFDRLFHAHPLPMWLCEAGTLRVRDANRSAHALTERSPEEITNRTYYEFLDEKSRDSLSRRLASIDGLPGPVDTVNLVGREGKVVSLRLQAFSTSWGETDCVVFLGAPLRGVERVFGTSPLEQEEITERLGSLSRRENDVLARVVYGETNKEIARNLRISPRTVEVYRASMLRKMGVRSTAHLLSMLTFDAVGRY